MRYPCSSDTIFYSPSAVSLVPLHSPFLTPLMLFGLDTHRSTLLVRLYCYHCLCANSLYRRCCKPTAHCTRHCRLTVEAPRLKLLWALQHFALKASYRFTNLAINVLIRILSLLLTTYWNSNFSYTLLLIQVTALIHVRTCSYANGIY